MSRRMMIQDTGATPQPIPASPSLAQAGPFQASPAHVLPAGMTPTCVLPQGAAPANAYVPIFNRAEMDLLHEALDTLYTRSTCPAERPRRLAISSLSCKLDDALFRASNAAAGAR